LAAALLAIAALFTVAACGGGDSTESSGSDGASVSGPAITKAELIKQADALCRKTDEIQKQRMSAYTTEHPEALSSKAALGVAMKEVALPPVHAEIEGIADLGMPPGDDAKLTAILGGMESALRAAEANPNSLVSFTEGPFISPGKLAARYGFKDCAKAL